MPVDCHANTGKTVGRKPQKEKKQESVWSRPVITGSSRTGKISVTIERNIR